MPKARRYSKRPRNYNENDLDWYLVHKKMIHERFKPTLSERIENIMMPFIMCLAIIFRPLNILIGGLITIIILLIK